MSNGSPTPFLISIYIVNYVTPGYATAVYVSASGVERIRTTAESHRRIAIIEVMGRRSGYIALGSAYGRPDIILVPEHPLDIEHLVERVKHLYDLQKNVVIVCGEGIVDEQGRELGAETKTTDPAGNIALSGAAEALRHKMMPMIGDRYFQLYRRGNSREAIFTRKVGHTQRGGRPILFDRFYGAQLGAKAVELWSKVGTTPCPPCSIAPARDFKSPVTMLTDFAIGGVIFMPDGCILRFTTQN